MIYDAIIMRGGILMIDFKEEIGKYKPVRTIEDTEDAANDEIMDIMDLLQHISGKPASTKNKNKIN